MEPVHKKLNRTQQRRDPVELEAKVKYEQSDCSDEELDNIQASTNRVCLKFIQVKEEPIDVEVKDFTDNSISTHHLDTGVVTKLEKDIEQGTVKIKAEPYSAFPVVMLKIERELCLEEDRDGEEDIPVEKRGLKENPEEVVEVRRDSEGNEGRRPLGPTSTTAPETIVMRLCTS